MRQFLVTVLAATAFGLNGCANAQNRNEVPQISTCESGYDSKVEKVLNCTEFEKLDSSGLANLTSGMTGLEAAEFHRKLSNKQIADYVSTSSWSNSKIPAFIRLQPLDIPPSDTLTVNRTLQVVEPESSYGFLSSHLWWRMLEVLEAANVIKSVTRSENKISHLEIIDNEFYKKYGKYNRKSNTVVLTFPLFFLHEINDDSIVYVSGISCPDTQLYNTYYSQRLEPLTPIGNALLNSTEDVVGMIGACSFNNSGRTTIRNSELIGVGN